MDRGSNAAGLQPWAHRGDGRARRSRDDSTSFEGDAPLRRVALVTGGAVRVGRAISMGLAEAGYDLAVHHHTSKGEAEALSKEVELLGRRTSLCAADLSDPAEIRRMCRTVREDFGRLDLLVNNASTFLASPLLEVSEREWDHVMKVNLRAPFLLVRGAADLLRSARGSVINIADLSAFDPWLEYPHHSVSKAALVHLTKVMARALAPEVRVNAIAPGTVLLPEDAAEEERDRSRRRTVLRTLGSPRDVVRTVRFLLDSPFVTGEVVVVDGGQRLHA